jgi:beta-lactamase superfamily II metal-dependent hydrolase
VSGITGINGNLEIVTFDVEHGSCHFLRLPNGKTVLIDLGSRPDFSPATHLRIEWGIRNLDWATITHQDADHIRDIDALAHIRPLVLELPDASYDYLLNHYGGATPETLEKFFVFKQGYNTPSPSMEHHEWGGVEFMTFKNDEAVSPNLNDLSVVTFAKYGQNTIIFPGDLEERGWLAHLRNPDFCMWLSKVNVFVASHHGRASGYCQEVFSWCKPDIFLVSDKGQTDTSITEVYRAIAKGVTFVSRDETRHSRHVLTTRNDGAILVSFPEVGRPYMSINYNYSA